MEFLKFGLLIYCITIIKASPNISLQMSTDEPLAIGDNVTFLCRVDNFPPNGTVKWWKRQGQKVVNLGTNQELDVDTDRYSLEIQWANTTNVSVLIITGITSDDEGEFGCTLIRDTEISASRNLEIIASPNISLQMSTDEPLAIGDNVTFHCRVDNFPPKGIVMWWTRLGKKVVKLGTNVKLQVYTDRYSLEVPQTNTTYIFDLSITGIRSTDEREFGCSLTPGEENIVYKNLVIGAGPIIECDDSVKIPLWTPKVSFQCYVFADPPLQELVWYWGNGYSLSPGKRVGQYQFRLLEMDKPDMKIARFYIDNVFLHMYRNYVLVAKNQNGISNHTLALIRDTENEPVLAGAAIKGLSITLLTLILLFHCCCNCLVMFHVPN